MKRKTAKAGKLRLSPNEEIMLLKEEYERRRKLRLQQVREQQKYIALQIRQKVKQRREEQLHKLEEALRDEWQNVQDEKMKALEKLYLSSLRAIGEGHRQAKENEPDLEALAKQAEERKQRAEKRHRKALKEQKYKKENLLHEQARQVNVRKHALEVEKQRAAKVARLPPPPPHPLQDLEVKKTPPVKPYSADIFSVTRYHILEPCEDREMDTERPDARLAAEEEGKRLEELHREAERETREQLEKAHLRGSHALKKVHLAQDRERLLKELEQLQNIDRMRRRQSVAQMPPQIFVPPCKRIEMKEEWQRQLEFAFEDMCCEDMKMKEDLILQFQPQPLPAPCDRYQDNDLDISLEQESACGAQPVSARGTGQESGQMIEEVSNESEDQGKARTRQPQSKLALKNLLNKIRSQKGEWTSKSEKETRSDIETIESGTIASEGRPLGDSELNSEQQKNTICEGKEPVEMLEKNVAAENLFLIHPQEKAAKIRMEEERRKWNEQIEQQKKEQLALLKQIEEEKAHLEAGFLKIQMKTYLEQAREKKEQGQLVWSPSVPSTDWHNKVEHETRSTSVSETRSPTEDSRLQMIRNYQQCLLQQNRLHKQTIEEVRKRLQEYQNKLKQRYLSASATPPSSMETKSVNLGPVSEPFLQGQGVQPAWHQSSEQVHAQECAWLLPGLSGTLPMLEKLSSQKHKEQMHNVHAGIHVQFLETSKLKHEVFHLLCRCPSQEQVGMLETSNNHVREPSWVQLPSGLVMKDVTTVRTQPEACMQHVRFVLPVEDSSELSETVHSKELPQKTSHHQAERERSHHQAERERSHHQAERERSHHQAERERSHHQAERERSHHQAERERSHHQAERERSHHQAERERSHHQAERERSHHQAERERSHHQAERERSHHQAERERSHHQAERERSHHQAERERSHHQAERERSHHQAERERSHHQAEREPPFNAPLMPVTKGSRIVRAASVDSLVCQQGSAESAMKTSIKQPLRLSESFTLSHEESKGEDVEGFWMSKLGSASLLNYSSVLNLRERVLASSESIQAQQKHLKELQEQIDAQREALLARQKIQEQLLLQKQEKLKQQQEALKEFLNKQVKYICTNEEMAEAQKPDWINRTDIFQVSENYQQVNFGRSNFCGSEMISQYISSAEPTEQSEKALYREQKWRSSKPPVAKVKLGLDLEQHELNIIPEVGTPKSCSGSFGAQSQDSQMTQDSPVLAAEIGGGVTTHSGPSFRFDNAEILSKEVSVNLGSEAFVQGIPFDLSSAISAGSFLTSGTLDASPVGAGLSSDSTEDRAWTETASRPWNSLPPFTLRQRQENLSGTSETQLPEGEIHLYKGSHIKEILRKCTGQLNLEDNTHVQAFAAELDFPEMERSFLNFDRQTFQPLEPSPGFDTSSSSSQYRISEDDREVRKTSKVSTKSQEKSAVLEVGTSNLNIQRSSLPSGLETNRSNNITSEESIKDNLTPGPEESFHQLPLDSPLSHHSQNADQPVLQRPFEQTPGSKKWGNCTSSAREYEELARNLDCISLQCSKDDLQNEGLNPLEEQKSFYQLNTTPAPMDESFPKHLLKDTVSSEKLPVETFDKYVKLPEKSVCVHEANKAVEWDSHCNTNIKEPDQGFPEVQKSSRVPRETNLEDSNTHLQTVVQKNGSVLERHEKHCNSVPRSSCHIPVWETESGHGIMEEPELTLISLTDISIAESDTEHANHEKIEDKINNPACVNQSEFNVFTEERELLPLAPRIDDSGSVRSNSSDAQSPNDNNLPSHQTAVMLLEFSATPGSLQESFFKRKEEFNQKSLKRVEEIKTKEREHEKPEAREFQRGKSEKLSGQKDSLLVSGRKGTFANQLKTVGEVKVSSPENRKPGETQMHQCTSRLCNRLPEVKIRKEEKTRQETHAKNREKAKEFQKKMLEKLRAK